MPGASAELLSVAMPLLFRFEEPRETPSAIKLTLPAGMPLLPVRVAVKMTADSAGEGSAEEARTVFVVPSCTVTASGADALAASFAFPAYVATIECVPTASMGLMTAVPDAARVALPRATVALLKVSVNVTFPAGVALPLVS